MGKPYVSYSSNAFRPSTSLPFVPAITWSRSTNPCSKVFKKECSSSLITFSINCFCSFNSGKASPMVSVSTFTNRNINGPLVSKNVKPYRMALLKILRITYPAPVLLGNCPSPIENETARIWSAITRMAISVFSLLPYF